VQATGWKLCVTAPRECNGHRELCGRRFDDVTFATIHNAYSATAANPGKKHSHTSSLASRYWANQDKGLVPQWDYGYRAFQLDTYKESEGGVDTMVFCHGDCSYVSVDAKEWLAALADLMHQNPNEVVTLIIENKDVAPEEFDRFLAEETRLGAMVFEVGARAEWPTLGDMITQNKRLVVIHENLLKEGDAPRATTTQNMWGLHPRHYSDPAKCAPLKPFSDDSRALDSLYVLNHFVSRVTDLFGGLVEMNGVPSRDGSIAGNTQNSVFRHVVTCWVAQSVRPNFVTIDFFNSGGDDGRGIIAAIDHLNTLSTVPFPSVTGPCVVTDGGACVSSPNHPADYGSGESCSITVATGVELNVESFATEDGYDFLTVNGVQYSGRELEQNRVLTEISGPVAWSSDYSVVAGGWKLCDSKAGSTNTGSQCSSDSECASSACGRATADDDAVTVCCTGAATKYGGFYYCDGMPSGATCWSDYQCDGNMICVGNFHGTKKGSCSSLREVGESCTIDSECGNDACGRPTAADGAGKVCCPSGDTTRFGGFDYCTRMPEGATCWSDPQCDSNMVCKGNGGGTQRGTCFRRKAEGEACPSERNADCAGSAGCYRTTRYGDYKCCSQQSYCDWHNPGCSTGYWYCASSGLGR
jgi:hypothetical protein